MAVHGQPLQRDHRRVHGIWYLVDPTRGQLANTFVFVSVHVEHRRAASFDEDTAAALDAQITEARREHARADPPRR